MNPTGVANNWLVCEIAHLASAKWERVLSEPDAVVFALVESATSPWPATLSIVAVAEDGWPTSDDLGRDTAEGIIRLAQSATPDQSLAFVDIKIDGQLPGSPLSAEMWIDTVPRLHLAAAATGNDLFELGRLLDELTDLLAGIPRGAEQRLATPDDTVRGRP